MCDSHIFGAGESDQAGARMLHQHVANRGAGSAEKIHHAGRYARFLEYLDEFRGDVGESLEGFKTTVLPVTIAAVVIPAVIAKGKFQGGMTTPTPSGR